MIKRFMFLRHALTVSILIALLFGVTSTLADNETDQDKALRLKTEGEILPLEAILEKAKTVRAGKVLEAELEKKNGGYIYEIEIIADDGSIWELKYDAKTATLLSQEEEDGH